MPSDSTMVKATGLIFFDAQNHFSLRGAFCHATVFMYSSWTYQGSPLCPVHLCSPQLKSFDFVSGRHVMASIPNGNHP